MPVEVIDLISSPDAPPPPRPRTKTKTNTAAAAPAPSRPSKRSPGRALDFDIPDLAEITHDGFISIPRTRPAPPARSPPRREPSPDAHYRASTSNVSFLSDDSTMLDPFGDALDARPRKKSRTSPAPGPPHVAGGSAAAGGGGGVTIGGGTIRQSASGGFQRPGGAASSSVGWGAPGVLQPVALRKWNSSADPIWTSSDADPFAGSPRQGGKEDPIDLSLDGDPLASSPKLVAGRGKQSVDYDPFASSPQSARSKGKAIAPPRPMRIQLPSSPLFVSSLPLGEDVASPRRSKPAAMKEGKRNALEWDHISSSAPSVGFRDDDWDMGPQPAHKVVSRSHSEGIDFDLGDLAAYDFGSDDDDEIPDITGIRPSKSSSSYSKSIFKVTKQNRASSKPSASTKSAAEKELERLDKEAEKRRKQREKEDAKEQRKREKERAAALADVNKVRTDKKVSTPEMLVDLPTSLDPSVKLQAETLLEDLSVKCHGYSSPVNNVVKWRRKVRAVFNETEGHWEPIPERIENEKHAMVIIKAPEFVELALGPNGSDLEAHVLRMQTHYEDHTLIYLIEGFNPWMRNNRTRRNRQFQSAVRSSAALDGGATAAAAPPPSALQQQSRRGKKKDTAAMPYVDEDVLEDALLRLQVQHGALIHHADAAVQTARWVAVFTQHISTIPYRRQRDAANASAAFCMDTGQVRTGEGARDAYVRMLQEMARITAPIAHGIAAEFGSPAKLVRGLEHVGPLALEDIRKSANRDGAYTDRTVGQAISRRVWKVFTGTDETSTDI